MNKTIITVLILIFAAMGGFFFWQSNYKSSISALSGSADQNQESPGNYETKEVEVNVEILREGSGDSVKSGDRVTVNYTGALEDGTKFDSSIDRGKPFVFTLGENSVIQGWELGVAGMKVGEKRRLTIPPELAYGEQGAGGIIPPNATLVFEIDLLEINQ